MNAFRTATNFAESPLTFAGRPHMGQRSLRRVDKAGHMIAVDLPVSLLIFLLHPRGRPHMHQSDSNRLLAAKRLHRLPLLATAFTSKGNLERGRERSAPLC